MPALRVRQYVCIARSCPRGTFVEQVPGLTRSHGRVTERLRAALGGIGLEPAARPARSFG